jgi:hypothetical protein
MTAPASHERAYRALLRLYPKPFRTRFGDELVQLTGDLLRDAREGRGRGGVAETWLRLLLDIALTAPAEHLDQRRLAHSLTRPPSIAVRVMGLAGVAGGFALVAAFLPHPPWTPETFNLRLVVFSAGAIAVALVVLRRRPIASRLIAPIAVVTIVANAWHIAMVLIGIGRPQFPEPDPEYRTIAMYAGVALWTADAAFGFSTWRIGGLARLAGLALGIGSLFAFSGMGNLGLIDGDFEWFFLPASQVGIALNGLGWILLGIAVATRRRPRPETATAASRDT